MPRKAQPSKLRNRGRSIVGEISAAIRLQHERVRGKAWPAVQWQKDPVGFIREVLHVDLAQHQEEIARAVIPENSLVAVSSGQKIGKTMLLACLMLWYWCCFPRARVTMTATTETQVDNVIWDEIKNVVRIAKSHNVDLLAGGATLAENPRTGLEAPDGRVIRGLTVRQIEAMGGISGENMFFVADEASSLSGPLAEAMAGNTAGGARMLWTSNPTQSEGPFYDCFHRFKKFWTCFILSSEDIAKSLAAKGRVIKGMATLQTIQMWEEMWTRNSPFFIVRVLGKFLQVETGKINPLHIISAAQRRWDSTPIDELEPLSIGVDAAGEGQEGDEWAFCCTRGKRPLDDIKTERGLDIDTAVKRIEELIKIWKRGRERVRVVIDAEGRIGSQLLGALRAKRDELDSKSQGVDGFDVIGVKASAYATREVKLYDRTRDEIWANLSQWLRNGGAIPPKDYMLETELHAPSWQQMVNGKAKATPKEILRKELGRSTDRADALALSVWMPSSFGQGDPIPEPTPEPQDIQDSANMYDQQSHGDPWWPSSLAA